MREIQDGAEVHYDAERGWLQLDCEPDAFAPYLEVVRGQLKDWPDIDFDNVCELQIHDIEKAATRSEVRRSRWGVLVPILILGILALAVIGLVATVQWISS